MSDDLTRYRTALADRYEIDREIGRGGTSTVYLGRDRRHDRAVALKFILPRIAGRIELKRFRQEIQIASGLQHPNILPVLDSGDVDGLPFFATPYVEGSSLQNVLDRRKTLPRDEVIRIVREIAEGLTYAHSRGIVHRDVKPGNILLSDGHAVLTDFGLALATDAAERLTDSDSAAGGTALYMSPEQMQGSSEPDVRTDVFSLACVAYEMLAGDPPFAASTAWAVMARQVSGTYPSLHQLRPDLPEATDPVLARGLHPDPSQRFESPRDFAQALEDGLESGPTPSGRRTSARLRVLAVAGAVALAAFGVYSIFPVGARALDPERVIVFPLVDTRAGGGSAAAGEETAIMIGAALDHAAPLRWIDGWDWLDADARAEMGSWSVQRGLEIARDRGAGHLIDGRIMEEGDSTRVLLRLHDVASGEATRRSLVAAPTRSASTLDLGRRALIDLLPGLIDAQRPVPRDILSGFDAAAVATWLQGERAYRNSEFEHALDLFQTAVSLDSTMALAAVRGAQAAGWLTQQSVVDTLLAIGLSHAESLPAKYVYLGEGLRSYYGGAGDEAIADLRRALDLDPEWSDAHMALGETHFHLPLRDGSDAEAAFQRAIGFDPGFTPARVHLAELALERGDLSGAASFAEPMRDPETGDLPAATHLDLMTACIAGGPDEVPWLERAPTDPLGVLETAIRIGVGGENSRCALAAYTALDRAGPPSYDWSAFLGTYSHLLATGRHDDALAAVRGAVEYPRQQHYLAVAGALAGAPFENVADAALAELEALEGDPPLATALWAIGAWNGSNGRPEGTAAALNGARRRAALGSANASDSLLVRVLEGWNALAAGDTTRAIERFSNLATVGSPSALAWDIWQGIGAERLTLARILLARNEYGAALRVSGLLDHPQPVLYMAYLPESLRIRTEAAEAIGQVAEAEEYRRRLESLQAAASTGRAGSDSIDTEIRETE